jgi:tRNA G37 N-methylase Trm5
MGINLTEHFRIRKLTNGWLLEKCNKWNEAEWSKAFDVYGDVIVAIMREAFDDLEQIEDAIVNAKQELNLLMCQVSNKKRVQGGNDGNE